MLLAHDHWLELTRCFRLGPVTSDPEYVTRGAMGEIWRVGTASGTWAVKWQFPWAPTDPRPFDLTVQQALAAKGMPLPLPVTTPAGDAVVLVGDKHARVYEWVELGPEITPPATPARAKEAGRLLGLLHQLAISSVEPVDPWYTEVPDAGHWAILVERGRSSGATWAAPLDAARGLIGELSDRIAPLAGEPIVCHRDFNPGNVLPATAGGHLVVLDWENCGPLQAGNELGYALFAWSAGRGQFDRAAALALLAAYEQMTGRQTAQCSTAIAAHLNVLKVMAERWLTEPEHRSYAGRQIDELLAHDLADLARFTEILPALQG